MYVSWSTSTTPPKPVHEPETVPSNLFCDSLYRIAPSPTESGVGLVRSSPLAIINALLVSIVTTPVPAGRSVKLPAPALRLVAEITLPSNLMLSTSRAPVTNNVLLVHAKLASSYNSPDVPANVRRVGVKSSTLTEASVV